MRLLAFLLAGLLMGPSWLDLPRPDFFPGLMEVAGGIFLFLAGWELRFFRLREDLKFYALAFAGAFLVPVFASLVFFPGNHFLAAALGISALPVAIQILKEKNRFHSKLGQRAITLASLCDLAAWVWMAFLFPAENLSAWLFSHWIVPAFFAGMAVGSLRPLPHSKRLLGFQAWVLAPVFFGGLGWKTPLLQTISWPVFLSVLTVAVTAKFAGTFFSAKWMGEKNQEAFELAAILNARGAMEILAAHFAFEAGLIDGAVFAALVSLGLVTSAMAVPFVRKDPSPT